MTLDQLRELEQAATAGPWLSEPDRVFVPEKHVDGCYCIRDIPEHDAALIAAMRNALPALLEFVEAVDSEAVYFKDGEPMNTTTADLDALRAALAEMGER